MADARVTGTGVPEMKLLAARLKEADPSLKRELRQNLREAAKPLAGDVQQSILSMPAKTEHGLRAEVAGTVKLTTSITKNGIQVTITSDGRRMPEGKQTLPHHLDSPKGWNHPVYGRAGPEAGSVASQKVHGKGFGHGRAWTWRHQLGKPGWFERPVQARAREFQAAAQKAIDAVQRKLGA